MCFWSFFLLIQIDCTIVQIDCSHYVLFSDLSIFSANRLHHSENRLHAVRFNFPTSTLTFTYLHMTLIILLYLHHNTQNLHYNNNSPIKDPSSITIVTWINLKILSNFVISTVFMLCPCYFMLCFICCFWAFYVFVILLWHVCLWLCLISACFG